MQEINVAMFRTLEQCLYRTVNLQRINYFLNLKSDIHIHTDNT